MFAAGLLKEKSPGLELGALVVFKKRPPELRREEVPLVTGPAVCPGKRLGCPNTFPPPRAKDGLGCPMFAIPKNGF